MKRMHRLVMALAGLLWSVAAHSVCSNKVGKVVFNELYQPNSGTSFIEVKVLDPSVVSSTNNFQNWKIDLYAGSFSNKQSVDFSSGFSNSSVNSCGQTSLWFRFPESVLSYLNSNTPPFNFVLYDSSGGGKIVDIFRVGNSSGNITSYYGKGTQYTTCPLIEDQLPATGTADSYYDALYGAGSSVKDWYRMPDGTGPWGGEGTSNPGNSSCGSNAGTGGGTYGLAKIPSTTTIPTNTNFSYTLYSINGATAVSSPASVSITDDLNAAGLTFVSCTTTRGTCTESGGVVTWAVGAVAANTSYTATLTVKATSAGSKTNSITSNVGSAPTVSAIAEAVTVFNPPANYGMDNTTWSNGTTVPDIGGSGNPGTVVLTSGTASSTTGIICTGVALNLGIGEGIQAANNAAFDISNGGTISFWIKPTDNTNRYLFSKGDEYFAYLNASGKLVFGSGNNGLFAYLKAWVTSATTIPTGSWTHVALVFDKTASKAYIYLNGAADANASSITAPTSSSDSLLLGSLDWATYLLIELTSGRSGYYGAMDEFKIFKAALSANNIWDLYNNELAGKQYDGTTRVCGGSLDHYEVTVPATNVACLASTVTVKACADTSNPCTNVATTVNGTATLGTSAGTLGATSLGFSSGVASTTLSYAGATNGAAATLTLSGESTTATNARTCCIGTSCSTSNTCAATFNTAGFVFAGSTTGASTTLPTQTAGTASSTYYLRAVQTGTTTGACIAALSGLQAVNMAYQCNNPTTCYAGNLMSVNGGSATTIQRNDNTGVTGYTAVNLTFDANGSAPFTYTYSDAGLVSLYAQKAASGSLLSTLTGSSNAFVVKPAGFTLTATCTADGTANAASQTTPGTGDPKFCRAGRSFSATATAVTSTGSTTYNYGRESTPETVAVSWARYAPTGTGTNAGTPPSGSFTLTGSFTGAFSRSGLSWDEVGILSATTSIGDSDYLGTGNVSSSAYVGRFYPDHFDVTLSGQQNCNGFAYAGRSATVLGQPFAARVTARNGAGNTTVNYSNATGFAKAVNLSLSAGSAAGTLYVDSTAGGTGAVPASKFANAAACGNLAAVTTGGIGTACYTDATGKLSYVFNTFPTTSTAIVLHAEDADTGTSTAGTYTDAGINAYAGRLRLANAYGSDLLTLRMPIYAEYWTGRWQQNTGDSCTGTSLAVGNFALGNRNPSSLGSSASSIVVRSSGWWDLVLAAPASAGSVDVALNLGAGTTATAACLSAWSNGPTGHTGAAPLAYLLSNWCGGSYDKNPVARAKFGSPKAPYIYLRERY